MAKFTRVPSAARSGADTFSDSIVGRQITDGSSQLTNTTFVIDRLIPDKDSKTFVTSPFSDFITLDNLNQEIGKVNTREEKIKFKGARDNVAKSLFGALKHRLNVSINRIIQNFPASFYIDNTIVVRSSENTLENIDYNETFQTTEFNFQKSIIFNPFDIVLSEPLSNTIVETENHIRNFYSSYTKYVLDYNNITYDIISYTEPNTNDTIILKVNGNPFSGATGSTESFLIRPNNGVTEEFFNNLDDVEELLLNRETNPKYTASFKVPRDSFDQSKTEITTVEVSWPMSRDGWNLQIIGMDYLQFVDKVIVLAEEIDEYKSDLVVRFLTAPQLYEFDTEDKKAESIFQLYGQSFDSVKKYIDNIAFMRHVSYDGIKNVPDLLLKNLSENLGLSTITLFDETSFNDTLYTRQDSTYGGVPIGKNLIESEYEFYRRLVTNLAHLYKSKGTRKSIEFFLRFLGAPEPMIKIDEYVYDVISLTNSQILEDDLYDLINGIKIDNVINGFTTDIVTYTIVGGDDHGDTITGYTLNSTSVTGTTTFTRDEYPVDENGLPRKTTKSDGSVFFQKGSGWYDTTLDHRSPLMIDFENSVLTGRTKSTKTMNSPYTYGEDYFNYFRTFQGLDYGFDLKSRIDNKKVSFADNLNESKLILNRKNINVFLSPSQTIEYDVWRQSRNNELTFGTLTPQTGFTFVEYLDTVINQVISNSNTIKYERNYSDLNDVLNDYKTNTGSTPYDFTLVNEYIQKMSPYWIKLIEQFIPATTLWTGGVSISNNKFNRSKYRYLKPNYGSNMYQQC
jgi:hypothetical protein